MTRSRKHLTVATIAAAAISLSALPAAAHVGVGMGGGGLAAGFAHPFSGMDHLVAIVGVGALAALRGRNAMLAIPAAFLAAMVLGAIVPIVGFAIPGAEVMIILSLLAVGALLGLGKRLVLPAVAGAVALFAFFHGVAHGNEMASTHMAAPYVLGFVVGAAVLLGLGMLAAAPVARLAQHLGRKAGTARS